MDTHPEINMNISHLGDALDHWKGCIIQMLKEHLLDLHIVPMFTDENVEQTWTQDRLQLYLRLLQLSQEANDEKILQRSRRFTAASRQSYFTDIADDQKLTNTDLFVDPDTGVAPLSGGDTKHIRPANILLLLPPESRRVVLVYQHSSREDNWTDACLQRVTNQHDFTGSSAFAYWAGSASMILLSRDRKRLSCMHETLNGLVSVLPEQIVRVTGLVLGQNS